MIRIHNPPCDMEEEANSSAREKLGDLIVPVCRHGKELFIEQMLCSVGCLYLIPDSP